MILYLRIANPCHTASSNKGTYFFGKFFSGDYSRTIQDARSALAPSDSNSEHPYKKILTETQGKDHE